MAFCFRVFPKISLMGKEIKLKPIPFGNKGTCETHYSAAGFFFMSLAQKWPLPSTSFPTTRRAGESLVEQCLNKHE